MSRRWPLAGLVLATILASTASAPAEHSLLEQVSIGPTGGNAETPAAWLAASDDGKRVFFRTREALTDDDTDTALDVYVRSGGQTTLLSPGEADQHDATFVDASDDGSVVAIETKEQLTEEDDDAGSDYYALQEGGPVLLSSGPTSSGDWIAIAGTLSADGSAFAFTTSDKLVDGDTDANLPDVYLYRAGESTPTLVSTGPTDPGSGLAILDAISDDGSRVVFGSNAPLVAGDVGIWDVYAYDAGAPAPALVSVDTAQQSDFAGASPDGSVVVFSTPDALSDSDSDTNIDLYVRKGSTTRHVSIGTNGGNSDAAQPAQLNAVSVDGSNIVFSTTESLVAADTDVGGYDIYVDADGERSVVSTSATDPGNGTSGYFEWMTPDASRIIFNFGGPLVDEDNDGNVDVYERLDGETTNLLSTGSSDGGNGDSSFPVGGASADGSRVLFISSDTLEPGDTDASQDVYERHAGVSTLISAGPGTGNAAKDILGASISADGTRAWFMTLERMLPSDTDSELDVYEKSIPAPVNTGAPTISGTPVERAAVLCTNGTWDNDPTAFAYRWKRDGAPIAGATSATYLIQPADVGRQLTCAVTASNAGGSAAATSAAVRPIAAQNQPPPPPPLPPRGDPLPGACANVQRGTGGKDRLVGTAAGDRLNGRGGNDRLAGGKGDDCLSGGGGKDRLRGGGGKDKLTGGKGVDKLDGGGGNDTIDSRDKRRETVRCGKGKQDRVIADRKDRLRGCERVKRTVGARSAAGGPGQAAAPAGTRS